MGKFKKLTIADSLFVNAKKMAVACPFHQEQTPSMMIDFLNKTYMCLGCGESGKINGEIVFLDNQEEKQE